MIMEPSNRSVDHRSYWTSTALKIGSPVLEACRARLLHEQFPANRRPARAAYAHLEVTDRYLSGIAPWLELPQDESEEGIERANCALLAREVLDAISDPDSPDCVLWNDTGEASGSRQPVVDASYVALALVRAPRELIHKLDDRVKRNLITQFNLSRKILPIQNNWLLFGAMLDTALYLLGADWDRMRVDYALRKHMDWYVGDGLYRDGDVYHWDYYNSYVIHPYLVDIVNVLSGEESSWQVLKPVIYERARRYAEILERLISPEGAFPLIGRSLTYRFGAFQALSQIALLKSLPSSLQPAQVRCALSAVIQRIMSAPGNFDENGWLRTGFCGSQPDLAEPYMSVGSQYLCANVFLALGLPPEDPFWSDPDEPWTSQKIYGGMDAPCEVALESRKS